MPNRPAISTLDLICEYVDAMCELGYPPHNHELAERLSCGLTTIVKYWKLAREDGLVEFPDENNSRGERRYRIKGLRLKIADLPHALRT